MRIKSDMGWIVARYWDRFTDRIVAIGAEIATLDTLPFGAAPRGCYHRYHQNIDFLKVHSCARHARVREGMLLLTII